MKTAVSLPDALFEEAEHFRETAGLSRSELYAGALREFLVGRSDSSIREGLDAVYAETAEGPAIDPVLWALQTTSLFEDDW